MTFELSNQGILDLLGSPVIISKKHIKVGNKFYPIDLWCNFKDDEIIDIHGGSVEFWTSNNRIIKSIIATENL